MSPPPAVRWVRLVTDGTRYEAWQTDFVRRTAGRAQTPNRCPPSMAYALVPIAGKDLWVNKWNWHPTIELLVRAGVFSSERAEPLHFNGGGDVTAAEAVEIAQFLTLYLLSMS